MPIPTIQLVRLLEGAHYHTTKEDTFQQEVAEVLATHGVEFEREFRLSGGDRVDFLVGRVAIEMKIKGGINAVLRQLQRYAQSPLVDEIILLTSRTRLCSMPKTLSDKPIHVALFIPGFA
jgi:hypothetical protein